MTGITMDELYDFLENNHEVEFVYNGKGYWMAKGEIWEYPHGLAEGNGNCIFPTKTVALKGESLLSAMLSDKCFDGKSFLEIESKIHIETVF